MKLALVILLGTLSSSIFAESFTCSDYKDTNIKYKELVLEITETEMIVSFPADTHGRERMVYPKLLDYGFKLAGFVQKTDATGAVFTFGVDIYKETRIVHRYIVSGPGFNLVYGKANTCIETGF